MRWMAAALVTALVLSGCASKDTGTDEAPDVVPPLVPDPLTSYLRNLSELVSVPTITQQFRTPIDELVDLDTWIIRPASDEPVPVVLEVTPYYGGGEPGDLGRVGAELVGRGYAVGVSSVRGTGQSGGCFTQGGPQEARDTAAVIEHIAQQPWSNGNVGLMGVSYPGTTPQDVWVEAPPSLKTIVPISGISDMYKYNFVNGVPINIQGFGFNTYYWVLEGPTAAALGLDGDPTDNDPQHIATAFAGEACTDQADVQQGGVTSSVDGNKDDYWQVRDFHKELRDSWERNDERASVFFIHGLQDWNVKPHMMEDWLPAIQETGVPFKIWLGQWGHAWPASTNPDNACEYDEEADRGRSCRTDWWNQTLVAWFDQFLKGVDTGVLDAPAVQVQDDDGVWRHERHWPPQDTTVHRLHLTQDALDTAKGSGSVAFHDQNGKAWDSNVPGRVGGGSAFGLTIPAVDVPRYPGVQGVDRVLWRSAPLASDWHVSGLPVFHANVTAEAGRAGLVLTLAEERADGSVRSINFAAQSLNHVQSLAAGTQSVADVRQEVEVRFFPQDDVIHNGSRIVLIAAGNTIGGPGPSLQPVSDGGMIRIDLDGAWLDLPVDHTIVVEQPQPYAKPSSDGDGLSS